MKTLVAVFALLSIGVTPWSHAWTQAPPPGPTSGAAPAPVPPSTPPAPAPLEPNPKGPLYRHTGEQYRVYSFPETGESIPYRLFVPTSWRTTRRLPLLVTLRAGTSVDNPYRPPNSLVSEAARRGINLRVMHPVELLHAAYLGESAGASPAAK